jgi:hypothetical protein
MSQSVKGTRDLRKLIPSTEIVFDLNEPYTTMTNGWVKLGSGVNEFAVYRTYIDIVGWSKDDITAFMNGASFQEGGPLLTSMGGVVPLLRIYDMVTTSYINDDQFTDNLILAGFGWSPPGFSNSNYNLEEVIAGRCRTYSNNTTTVANLLPTLMDQTVWGAGDSTAADRIHITKAIYIGTSLPNSGFIYVPDSAVVIPTLLVEESDLVYLERLRRSYVLAENR